MPHTLATLIVKVNMSLNESTTIKSIHVHAESVVLRCDFDTASGQVLDWVVHAAMAELELVGPSAKGEAENLVTEANAEDGQSADEVPGELDDTSDGLGIASAVGQHDAVRLEGENLLGGEVCGHGDDLTTAAVQVTQNALLHAAVDDHDVGVKVGRCGVGRWDGYIDGQMLGARRVFRVAFAVPAARSVAGNFRDEVSADQLWSSLGPSDSLVGVQGLRGDEACLDPVGP